MSDVFNLLVNPGSWEFLILSWPGTLVCSLLFIVEHLSGLVAKTILAFQNDMEEFLCIYFLA